ncbi:MAG: type II toxin-antitoxin system VapC family toxin [Pseudonocardiales bacterium]|nr:type II toxin-antitoxin system VapC family toxin [Pseudonocardiales bacterium]
MIYLDSNTLCRFIIGKDVETVGRVIEAVDAGEAELIVSPLLLVECRGQPRSGSVDKELERRLLGILDNPRHTPVEFTRAVALKARDLALHHGIKNYDAIHLAHAIMAEADVLMTTDKGFPLETEVDGMWVGKPYYWGPATLFDDGDG